MTLSRRHFLRTLAVTASAVAVTSTLAGCDNSSESSSPETQPSIQPGPQFFPQSLMSGDPRPDSVILWTRLADGSGDKTLTLQLSDSDSFDALLVETRLDVQADFDHCLKVRVSGLMPGQHYYYRFLYEKDGVLHASNTGRTKTAPAQDADVPVKFAFVSCQDYIGRYYNTYHSILAQDDIDFVAHLGDYIYETTGDASFQATGSERSIAFRDSEGALTVGQGEAAFQAAQSLDNYRQLYQEYRSDALLQEVHERFPLVAIWDDHEFSDDSWQQNGTYLDGTRNEANLARKHNSERAYFEYMPIDQEQAADPGVSLADGQVALTDEQLFPNTRIYRDLRFGQHLHLFMTDYRSFRPDHLIPEDAFPGTVVMDEATTAGFIAQAKGLPLDQATALVKSLFSPYIDIDDAAFAQLKAVLTGVFQNLYIEALMAKGGLSQEEALAKGAELAGNAIQGKLATGYLNAVIAQLPAELGLSPIDDSAAERGIAFYSMGKTDLFNFLGARYLVIKDTFDIYAAFMELVARGQGGSVQSAYDANQLAWLQAGLAGTDATHKVVGSSVSFAPLLFDLSADRPDSGLALLENILDSEVVPELLKQRFYINVDHWDGFPQVKASLINELFAPLGVVTIAGDVHSSYVTEHAAHGATGNVSVDFTTSSVSSGTFGSFLTAGLNGILAQLGGASPEVAQLPAFFDLLAFTASQRDDVASTLRFARMHEHGVAVAVAGNDGLEVTYHNIPAADALVKQSHYQDAAGFLGNVVQHRFRLADNALSQLS
ncbi:alkaline phosphatase D family protein [Gallaecimonas sp. GXIMD4217]|uniref:alkaline phosphatase D family protein n=1 Tax=Gallaecimonas sp. GXIMD4217 TaxID=3131927 RepID=UPI00311AE752